MGDALSDAAHARRDAVASRAARPSQRRSGQDPNSPRGAVVRAHPVLREAGGAGPGTGFAGLASSTNTPYQMWDFFGAYTEIVSAGAFTKTLARDDLDVPLVLQHVDLRRLARTTIPAGELGHLQLSEDNTGLVCSADLDPTDPDVAYITPKIRAGLVDEMSFRFMITAGQWSPDWTEYHIDEVDIHRGDVAICGFGANPHTSAELRAPGLAEALRRATDTEARQALATLNSRFAPRTFVVSDADLT